MRNGRRVGETRLKGKFGVKNAERHRLNEREGLKKATATNHTGPAVKKTLARSGEDAKVRRQSNGVVSKYWRRRKCLQLKGVYAQMGHNNA